MNGSDQLMLIHITFEPRGIPQVRQVDGTSSRDTLGLRYLMVRPLLRRPPKHEHAEGELGAFQQHDGRARRSGQDRYAMSSERRPRSLMPTFSQAPWTLRELGEPIADRRDLVGGDPDPSPRSGALMEPDGGLWRLL